MRYLYVGGVRYDVIDLHLVQWREYTHIHTRKYVRARAHMYNSRRRSGVCRRCVVD